MQTLSNCCSSGVCQLDWLAVSAGGLTVPELLVVDPRTSGDPAKLHSGPGLVKIAITWPEMCCVVPKLLGTQCFQVVVLATLSSCSRR